jgi:hypothetical protein
MNLIDTDKLKFPNIAIFDMKLHGVTVPMVRLIDLQMLMPTVDAAPVKYGRWIKGGYACGENEYKCSVCGETEWRTGCKRMKYCMYCGAKMDSEEQDARTEQSGK